MQFVICFCTLLIIVVINSRKRIIHTHSITLMLSIFIAITIYTFAVLYSYLFFWFDQESFGYTASFTRYIGCTIGIINIVSFIVISKIFIQYINKIIRILIATIIAFLLIYAISPNTYIHSLIIRNSQAYPMLYSMFGNRVNYIYLRDH